MQKRLEVCVDSVESAVIAQKEGADRLEVCANLMIGGTTCGVSQFKQIRKLCDIELNVLIRPRFGDFLYTAAEFQMLADDIEMFRELGADGVVVGCLNQLIEQAEDRIEILLGGGVNAGVIRQLKKEIHASSFHMSGKHKTDSGMIYRNTQVNMGFGGFSEYELFYTEGCKIREARQALDEN